MQWNNQLTELLGIKYPIIQAPMLGVSTPEMAAAVSNEGGLGSLAIGGMNAEQAQTAIRQTKALTGQPFAVNFFAHDVPQADADQVKRMYELLRRLAAENGLEIPDEDPFAFKHCTYRDQVDVLLDENIHAISFTFGIPDRSTMQLFKKKGMITTGTATCVEEAIALDRMGVDMITAQGIEAGGHRGGFLDMPLPLVGLMSLVPGIRHAVNKPVIAAGGIHDGRTACGAFMLGAMAVQPGTAFVASDESLAIPSYKTALKNATDTDAVLTKAFSGRWARGIHNKFMEAIDKAGIAIPPYPIQNSLTTLLRKIARQKNNKDFINLWAGQSAFHAEELPSREIFLKLVNDIEAVAAMAPWSPLPR